MAEQLTLKRQFDAFQALVVDPGEADDVRGHFAVRIVAAIFPVLADAGQLERRHLVTDFRR